MGGSEAHQRLPEPHGRDEIALLGSTLNGLLDRIEAFVDRERAFLDDASHELRTPLTVLRGELELAVDDPDPDQVRRSVRVALGEAERLSALAQDLLVLARQRSGEGPAREPVAILAWIDQVDRWMHENTGPAGRIQVEARGDPALVGEIDPNSMQRALTNLITNAQRAGGTRVRIAVSADPSAPAPPHTITIDVDDDGPGFPVDLLPRAFHRFARADSARTRATHGQDRTGLGLAIVAAIVTAHHGEVSASNDSVFGGARVRIRLPAQGPPDRDFGVPDSLRR